MDQVRASGPTVLTAGSYFLELTMMRVAKSELRQVECHAAKCDETASQTKSRRNRIN